MSSPETGANEVPEEDDYTIGMRGVSFGMLRGYSFAFVTRVDGKVTSFNQRTVFIDLGYSLSPDDVMGQKPDGGELKDFREILPPEADEYLEGLN